MSVQRYYEEQTGHVTRPLLGSLSGSFSSSGSMSGSLDSPLRDRSSTWGFVEVPPAIAENQTPSDAGNSAESGFHDMSRQASKTESSESAAECTQNDQALEELIKQSAEYGESETSRSSSDTITPEEHVCEDGDQSKGSGSTKSSQGNVDSVSDNNDSAESSVFEENNAKFNLQNEEYLRGINTEESISARNYDTDFPPALKTDITVRGNVSDKQNCDVVRDKNLNQESVNAWKPESGKESGLKSNVNVAVVGEESCDDNQCDKTILKADSGSDNTTSIDKEDGNNVTQTICESVETTCDTGVGNKACVEGDDTGEDEVTHL